jgi:UDP-glucose 4-epimerase
MRSLVTGGAGFVGSHLVDALLSRGDRVTIVDDISTGRRENIESALRAGAELVELDIRDRERLLATAADISPDTVFHLAAQVDVRKSVADPSFDASINVGGTLNVLEAACTTGVRRFVFCSTGGAIYGEGQGQQLPLTESAPLAPLAPYGQSKLAAEGYISLYRRLHGLSAVSLRLGNVYGPRQDPLGEAGVIAIFCGRLQAGERPTVFGDGRQTRDYIYVGDVVAALIAAASSDATGEINIGTGVETDILTLVETLRSLSGRESFEPEFAPPRTGEVEQISIDPALAWRELAWKARIDLDAGLRSTITDGTVLTPGSTNA